MNNIKNKTDRALDLIFPARCPLCDGVLEFGKRGPCEKCRYSLPYVKEPVCFKCGREISDDESEYCGDCAKKPRSFNGGFPLLNYVEPAASSVLRLKYKGRQEYAPFYAKETVKKYGDIFKGLGIDAIIPVPLYKRKLKSRGFNQAELLAREISRLTRIPLRTDILIRINDTIPQKKLSTSEREENLINAFTVKGKINLEKVLIADDIYTTGATIEACTQALKKNGVKCVYYTSICIGKS